LNVSSAATLFSPLVFFDHCLLPLSFVLEMRGGHRIRHEAPQVVLRAEVDLDELYARPVLSHCPLVVTRLL
jgi:hypothetical protein